MGKSRNKKATHVRLEMYFSWMDPLCEMESTQWRNEVYIRKTRPGEGGSSFLYATSCCYNRNIGIPWRWGGGLGSPLLWRYTPHSGGIAPLFASEFLFDWRPGFLYILWDQIYVGRVFLSGALDVSGDADTTTEGFPMGQYSDFLVIFGRG